VEKLFSSMKSDIGIRPIRAWTDDGVYGVLLIGFLAQALIAMTRLLAKPADGRATKFISDAMQKLTLTVRRKGMEGTEFILSNFNSLNQAILRAFGVIPEVFRCENKRKKGIISSLRPRTAGSRATVKFYRFPILSADAIAQVCQSQAITENFLREKAGMTEEEMEMLMDRITK
jgi:hypothetical protein